MKNCSVFVNVTLFNHFKFIEKYIFLSQSVKYIEGICNVSLSTIVK